MFRSLCFSLLLLLTTSISFADGAANNPDPYENFNRKVFAFNDTLDKYLLKPVAKGYKKVTPKFLNRGVSNMFDNVSDVPGAVNSLLQGKGGGAVSDTSRFLINSTVGLVGFFDVASTMGIESSDEDFGQTLTAWTGKQGPYVMIPFLGGRTLTNATGLGVDTYLNPVSYVDHVPTKNTLRAVDVIDTRADLLDAEKLLDGDRYTLYREAYLQRRSMLVNDGKVEDSFGEDAFEDDIFDE